MTVPFLDLARGAATLAEEIEEAVAAVVASGRFHGGPPVEDFERDFAGLCGVPHAVGVASGTNAITLALVALGIGPGDEVITAANTCVATVSGIVATGARPVLADVDAETLTLHPPGVEDALTARTRAIVAVHLYGQCADAEALAELACARGVELVEDAAHAHGALLRGRPVGSLGRAAAFSFYPTKNLGALGDGGAVVTADEDVAARVRLLRAHGEHPPGNAELRGTASRLDALQAAVLRVKLRRLEEWNERRRALAGLYREALADLPVVLPEEAEHRRHVYHLFVVQVEDRDRVREALAADGIETRVHYPLPVHRQDAYAELDRPGRLGTSERLAQRIVSLPLYPELREDELERTGEALRRALAGRRSIARAGSL
ncbi:MAG: DegT/DnrJ/EryC1/StrS family aminotransferase [Gaiellaceae bacterium]